MKEIIIVEEFDNGISIAATSDEGTERRVALDHTKEQEIGKIIWESVKFIMDKDMTNTVRLEIDYSKI